MTEPNDTPQPMPRSKEITLEAMRLFSGPGENIHTDHEKAQEIGLSEPIAAGAMLQAYVSEWLFAQFGDAWLERGTMDIAFVDPVYPGDTLLIDGTITDRDDGITVDIECQVHDGDEARTVIVGSAGIRRG